MYQSRLSEATTGVVRLQKQAGISIPGDGEFGKEMGQRVNYGAWWSYSVQRLGGLKLGTELYRMPPKRSTLDHVTLTSFGDRRDRAMFAAAYADPESGVPTNRGGPGMKLLRQDHLYRPGRHRRRYRPFQRRSSARPSEVEPTSDMNRPLKRNKRGP